MPKTRIQKEESVVKLQAKLDKSKALVFVDYKGLNMKQLSDLRNLLREQNAEFNITKNSLLDLAFRSSNHQLQTANFFNGPIATLFAYDDEISPLKTLVKALKDAALGKIKGGFLGTEALDETKVNKLALLPGKDELRGKTVGVLVAPLQGIVSVLGGNLRNLVYALNQIKVQKGGE